MFVDPLAEQTMEPYLYAGNNPIRYTDPTGMSKEGAKGPPKKGKVSMWQKLRADMTNAYSASGFRSAALWWEKNSPFTPAKPQVKIRSNEDIGSSARAKDGGNQHPTTTGNYLEGDHGGSFNVDYILGAASAFGGPYSGNKYKSLKDGLEVVKNVVSGYGLGETTGEKSEQTYKEFVPYIKSVDISTNDDNSTSTATNFGVMEVEGTKEEIQAKMDSLHQEGIKKGEKALEKK